MATMANAMKTDREDDIDGVVSPSSNEDAGEEPSILSGMNDSVISSSIVCRDVYAPPGKLNIVIHATRDGPAVHAVKQGSCLEGHLFSGDLIIEVDNVDTREYTAEQVMKMMASRSEFDRKITVLHLNNKVAESSTIKGKSTILQSKKSKSSSKSKWNRFRFPYYNKNKTKEPTSYDGTEKEIGLQASNLCAPLQESTTEILINELPTGGDGGDNVDGGGESGAVSVQNMTDVESVTDHGLSEWIQQRHNYVEVSSETSEETASTELSEWTHEQYQDVEISLESSKLSISTAEQEKEDMEMVKDDTTKEFSESSHDCQKEMTTSTSLSFPIQAELPSDTVSQQDVNSAKKSFKRILPHGTRGHTNNGVFAVVVPSNTISKSKVNSPKKSLESILPDGAKDLMKCGVVVLPSDKISKRGSASPKLSLESILPGGTRGQMIGDAAAVVVRPDTITQSNVSSPKKSLESIPLDGRQGLLKGENDVALVIPPDMDSEPIGSSSPKKSSGLSRLDVGEMDHPVEDQLNEEQNLEMKFSSNIGSSETAVSVVIEDEGSPIEVVPTGTALPTDTPPNVEDSSGDSEGEEVLYNTIFPNESWSNIDSVISQEDTLSHSDEMQPQPVELESTASSHPTCESHDTFPEESPLEMILPTSSYSSKINSVILQEGTLSNSEELRLQPQELESTASSNPMGESYCTFPEESCSELILPASSSKVDSVISQEGTLSHSEDLQPQPQELEPAASLHAMWEPHATFPEESSIEMILPACSSSSTGNDILSRIIVVSPAKKWNRTPRNTNLSPTTRSSESPEEPATAATTTTTIATSSSTTMLTATIPIEYPTSTTEEVIPITTEEATLPTKREEEYITSTTEEVIPITTEEVTPTTKREEEDGNLPSPLCNVILSGQNCLVVSAQVLACEFQECLSEGMDIETHPKPNDENLNQDEVDDNNKHVEPPLWRWVLPFRNPPTKKTTGVIRSNAPNAQQSKNPSYPRPARHTSIMDLHDEREGDKDDKNDSVYDKKNEAVLDRDYDSDQAFLDRDYDSDDNSIPTMCSSTCSSVKTPGTWETMSTTSQSHHHHRLVPKRIWKVIDAIWKGSFIDDCGSHFCGDQYQEDTDQDGDYNAVLKEKSRKWSKNHTQKSRPKQEDTDQDGDYNAVLKEKRRKWRKSHKQKSRPKKQQQKQEDTDQDGDYNAVLKEKRRTWRKNHSQKSRPKQQQQKEDGVTIESGSLLLKAQPELWAKSLADSKDDHPPKCQVGSVIIMKPSVGSFTLVEPVPLISQNKEYVITM